MQVARFRRNQKPLIIGTCHDDWLVRLVRHVNASGQIAPRDKARIIQGIARYLNAKNA